MIQKQELAAIRKKEELARQEGKASSILGAGARGYAQRKKDKQQAVENEIASVRIQAQFRGRKERSDPSAETKIRRERTKNDPQVRADVYVKEHKLVVKLA